MSRYPFLLIWWLLCGWGSRTAAYGQARADTGSPPMRVFLPSQYNAHSQNFALTQDRRGVLYVGNFAGVLEYDGLSWRTISTASITKVSALLTAADGKVYVGANGEFGYLRPDSVGTLRFRSLSERGPGQPRLNTRFSGVLAVLEASDGIYFVAREAVFRWDGRTVREWPTPAPVASAFQYGPDLYLFQQQRGLSHFRQGTWQPVSRAADVPALYDLVALLPLPGPGKRALLVTSNQGLFQLTNTVIRPFVSAANDALKANQATGAAVLSDHNIVVATVRRGLVQLGPSGQRYQLIPGTARLGEQFANALFVARGGSLWLALNNGLLQLEVPTPLTLFSESAQQMGEVTDIRRVGGTLYAAAANGLFSLYNGTMRPVPGLGVSCFGLAEAQGRLCVATGRGVYHLTANGPRALTQEYAICLAASRTTQGRFYVGTQTGLNMLTIRPGQTSDYQPVPGLSEQVFGIVEVPDGSTWVETLKAGLYRVLPGGEVRRYTAAQGLPTLLYNRVAATTQGLLAYNDKGIFRYEATADKFVPHNPFGNHRVATNWKNELAEDAAGNVWTVGGDKKSIALYEKKGAAYAEVTAPFLPLSTSPINVIYPDQAGIVWFGGRDGLVRYDEAVRKSYALPYQALIRRVQTVGEQTLYDGVLPLGAPVDTLNGLSMLAATASDISFKFAAATYPVVPGLTFQCQLENYDRVWSDWTTDNTKEYTNLPPGQYRFRVRARNIYNAPSREASYAFTVRTPWYLQWWAIGLMMVAVGLVGTWLVRWRLAAVVREKQALENLIQERTEEVVSQKAELEKQSSELADKNDQLEKIDLIVQSINAEIDSNSLFNMVLAKFSAIRNMHSSSFLVFDKPTNEFRFKALRGTRELSYVQDAGLTLEQAETRFLAGAREVYEDIYLHNPTSYAPLGNAIDGLAIPKSLVTIVIENEGRIEGFITLENNARPDAFDQRDIDLICNLKEHLIAAFIKTRLLESLENTLHDLENTQDELIRQERLASVGQLTKGIVDRILNPLNYVTNFSQSSDEMIGEVVTILEKQQDVLSADTLDDLLDELNMLKSNSLKIQEHSNSTTRILKDMQKLLKEKSREFVETDLNSVLDARSRGALQELKGEYQEFTVNLILDLTPQPVRVSLLPFEFGQVVQSLMSNAYYTLFEKSKTAPDFTPEIRVSTTQAAGQVVVRIRDNGKGIAPREVAKLFSPFFTTKPTSKGTGLGLFMTKDIVETHKGKITIDSQEGNFTLITIILPTTVG